MKSRHVALERNAKKMYTHGTACSQILEGTHMSIFAAQLLDVLQQRISIILLVPGMSTRPSVTFEHSARAHPSTELSSSTRARHSIPSHFIFNRPRLAARHLHDSGPGGPTWTLPQRHMVHVCFRSKGPPHINTESPGTHNRESMPMSTKNCTLGLGFVHFLRSIKPYTPDAALLLLRVSHVLG